MSQPEDLHTVIEDSITDAVETPEIAPEPTSTEDLGQSAQPTVEPSAEAPVEPTETTEVKPATDDFEKRFGLVPQTPGGRENRIPYSRVKKITDKAVSDAKSEWTKNLETSYVPVNKYQETEAKVKDYESRLTKVAEFERVMTQQPEQFLDMLSRVPAYSQFFKRVIELAQGQQQTAQPQVQAAPVDDDMPQPDQKLSDGSLVYSLDGLKKLNEWNRAQSKREALSEFEKKIAEFEQRYAPLEQDYNRYQTVQSVLPAVQRQIAEARTWPQFTENEEAITKVLTENPQVSLEGAYRHVVLPKLQQVATKATENAKVEREKLRAEILAELKQAPRSTSATTGVVKTSPTSGAGTPRSLEEVIADSIKGLNR